MTTYPLVSIITPTFNRAQWLPLIHRCVSTQDFTDFEWLVLDDSSEPSDFMLRMSDKRIKYLHHATKLTIGAKRNILIDQAVGQIVAHFDDDDYYAKKYLSRMLSIMKDQNADFVKLFGFFLFSRLHEVFAYWDTTAQRALHFRLHSTKPITTFVANEKENAVARGMHLGFGFSYVFKKKIWNSAQFAEVNWNEEAPVVENAVQQFKMAGVQDSMCSCLHVLHETNNSVCWPQYILPRFLVNSLFADASRHVGLGKAGLKPEQVQLPNRSAE